MIIFVILVGVLCILVSLMLTLLIVWMKEDDVNSELKKIYLLLNHKNEKDPK